MRTLTRVAKSQAKPDTRRATATPARNSVADLQRSLGNQSVQHLAAGHEEAVGDHASAGFRDLLHAPGQPLDAATRADMEARFGYDFGDVQIHLGEHAADAASAAGAKAYTVGRHIVFGGGHYAPQDIAGRQLLAHELAHVVQQSRGGTAPAPEASSSIEAAAEQAAVAATQGDGAIQVSGASGVAMARQEETDEERKRRQQAQTEPATTDSGAGPGFSPGNFPFANPTSGIGLMPSGATDFDFTLGLSLLSGLPNPVPGRPSLLGGGVNALQFSFRNQMFTPGLDLGLAFGLSSLSQGGSSSKDFAQSYYATPTLHYAAKIGDSDFGWAAYLQPSLGFRQGAGVPSNYPGLIGTQATGVFGFEPDSGWGFDANLTGGWSSVNSFSAGPTLADPFYLGGQGSIQYTFLGQHWAVMGEGFGYYERGSGFVGDDKIRGPGATGARFGFGLGLTNNTWGYDWATGTPKKTDTIGLNFDYSRENITVPGTGATAPGAFSTNTFLLTLTLGNRKLQDQQP